MTPALHSGWQTHFGLGDAICSRLDVSFRIPSHVWGLSPQPPPAAPLAEPAYFTAPNVNPCTRYRCKAANTTATGSVASNVAAIT